MRQLLQRRFSRRGFWALWAQDRRRRRQRIEEPGEGGETPPLRPEAISVSTNSGPYPLIQWTDGSDNETGFEIWRRVDWGDWDQLDTVSADVTEYEDNSATLEQFQEYKVRAVNDAGESEFTESVGWPDVPEAPSNLSATEGDYTVQLSWDITGDLIHAVEIWRDEDYAGFSHYDTLSGGQTWYEDSYVTEGMYYQYQVRAMNGAGASEFSNAAEITPSYS